MVKKIIFILLCMILIAGCNTASEDYTIKSADMKDYTKLRWEQDSTLLVIAGNDSFPTKQVKLAKGKYTISFKARGTLSKDILPHLLVKLRNYTIKDLDVAKDENNYSFNFELPESVEAPVVFTFDNDYSDSTGDRNIFLTFPIRIKPY